MNIYYMNGAGNDFMVMDAREDENRDFSNLAKEYCAITGADGFMAVGKSDIADFRLHFYNSDGTRGEMCGNGARCICRYAYEMGIAGAEMTVETDAGLVPGKRIDENEYRVKLNNPEILDLSRKGPIAYVELGNPGVPHGVVEVPGLDFSMAEDLRSRGKALRYDPAFPKGANINFFAWIGENRVRVMTYERGVEDYTLACGTGCGSTAATLFTQGKLPDGKLLCHCPGGDLQVTVGEADGVINSIELEGPATIVKIYDL